MIIVRKSGDFLIDVAVSMCMTDYGAPMRPNFPGWASSNKYAIHYSDIEELRHMGTTEVSVAHW